MFTPNEQSKVHAQGAFISPAPGSSMRSRQQLDEGNVPPSQLRSVQSLGRLGRGEGGRMSDDSAQISRNPATTMNQWEQKITQQVFPKALSLSPLYPPILTLGYFSGTARCCPGPFLENSGPCCRPHPAGDTQCRSRQPK